jgi:hypothetical protein
LAVPSTASSRYDTYIGMGCLIAALSIKLTEVLYVPRIW